MISLYPDTVTLLINFSCLEKDRNEGWVPFHSEHVSVKTVFILTRFSFGLPTVRRHLRVMLLHRTEADGIQLLWITKRQRAPEESLVNWVPHQRIMNGVCELCQSRQRNGLLLFINIVDLASSVSASLHYILLTRMNESVMQEKMSSNLSQGRVKLRTQMR